MDGREPKKPKILPTSPPICDFPSDVLRWMKRNSSPKMALKLMQICKYFQHQEFPYFVVLWLRGKNERCEFDLLGEEDDFFIDFSITDLGTLQKQLWLSGKVYLSYKNDLILSLLPKIAVCDISELNLGYQNCILFEQFKVLTDEKNLKILMLENTIIKDGKNEAIALEKIFECVPNLHTLYLYLNFNTISSAEQATIFMPTKLKTLEIEIEDNVNINIEECFKFIQENQKIYFDFRNFTEMSIESVAQLQELTNNLIENWSTEYQTPGISFIGQTTESKRKLRKLEEKHQRQRAEKLSKT